jgi:C-terminal processing protease CtpA/Prc
MNRSGVLQADYIKQKILCLCMNRSGVLQAGDRVLAINGQYLENRSLEDAQQMVKDSGVKVTLQTEFDVAGWLLFL